MYIYIYICIYIYISMYLRISLTNDLNYSRKYKTAYKLKNFFRHNQRRLSLIKFLNLFAFLVYQIVFQLIM